MMMAITSKCRRRREYLSHKLWLKWNIYSCLMFLWAIHQTDLQDTRKESVNKTSTRQPFASKNEESLLLLLLLPSINVHLAYSSCKARLDVKSRLSLRSVIKVYNVFQETEFWSNSKRERERERPGEVHSVHSTCPNMMSVVVVELFVHSISCRAITVMTTMVKGSEFPWKENVLQSWFHSAQLMIMLMISISVFVLGSSVVVGLRLQRSSDAENGYRGHNLSFFFFFHILLPCLWCFSVIIMTMSPSLSIHVAFHSCSCCKCLSWNEEETPFNFMYSLFMPTSLFHFVNCICYLYPNLWKEEQHYEFCALLLFSDNRRATGICNLSLRTLTTYWEKRAESLGKNESPVQEVLYNRICMLVH